MNPITPISAYLQDPGKTLPMLLIEVPTVAGRVYQGYNRGGETEGREKICEETAGTIFWLFGIQAFNKIGDFIGKNIFGLKDLGTDVGKDALRNPFGYVTEKRTATTVFKFSKIAASTLLGTLMMGAVLPKIKKAMTNAIRENAGLEPYPDKNSPDGRYHPGLADKFVRLFIKPKQKDNGKIKMFPSAEEFCARASGENAGSVLSFGNMPLSALLYASHNLENNTAWRLLSTDVGTLTGRVANSRTKKEGIEYAFRDSLSSVFYIFAAPAFSALLRKVSNSHNINAIGAEALRDRLIETINNSDAPITGNMLTSKLSLSSASKEILNSIKFSNENTITLDEFNKQTGGMFAQKALKMSKLQPEYINSTGMKASILSKRQVQDVLSNSEISNPEFLKSAISRITNGKSDDPKSFISRKRLEKIRDSFDNYVISLEKYANKKTGGIITEDLLNKFTKRTNIKNLGIYLAGVAFAAFCLSFVIPKAQYWISEKITGEKEFLGENELAPKEKTTV